MSSAQRRLWFLEQLEDLGSAYHLSGYFRLRGALDEAALVRALNQLVARHDALRTTFHDVDGLPEQVIAPAEGAACSLRVHDLSGRADAESELRRRMVNEAEAPFDLRRGPLFRATLFRMAADDHPLLFVMHHIVFDAWSMRVLADDLGALYAGELRGDADSLPPLPLAYADHMSRQREDRTSERAEVKKQFWRNALAGVPALLDLPTDHPRPSRQQYGGDVVAIHLDADLTAGLKALGERHGTTLYRTLLSAWAIVVGRLAGQDDVVVGVPMANRVSKGAQRLIGFFVDTVALRVDLSGDPTVAELLQRVHRHTREAARHRDVPFEDVVSMVAPARNLAHHPIYQTGFSWHNVAQAPLSLPGLLPAAMEEMPRLGATTDTALSLWEDGEAIAGNLEYATALFDRAAVERWVGYLRRVVAAMVADESLRVDRIPLLDAAERALVLEEWNRTEAAYPAEISIHGLFEQQVDRTPDAIAVEFAGEHLTYAELNRRANRLAHHLRSPGVHPEARVAIALERSAELIVAMLAVLKAGGAYVPLDPGYPAERLRFMLEDSGAAVLLARRDPERELPAVGAPVVWLDEAAERIAYEPSTNPGVDVAPGQLCYVVYTSGSTGRPKGVAAEHHEVVHLVRGTDFVSFGPGDRVAQASNASFDALTFEAWGALLGGATLVGIAKEVLLAPAAFREVLREQRISTLYQTTALLNLLSREQPDIFATLREVLFGGQAVEVESVRRVLRGGKPERLVHVYGPTEVMAWCSWEDVRAVAEGARTVSVGRPITRMRMYILDRHLEPAPVGVAGEIYVGGVGVARGYLDRPELTADRFVADPFGGEPGARLYRTGDLGRWKADGTLEFVGRNDEQVKIRGFRIELGEIEARLAEHPDVREAVVLAREDMPGDQRLVAYWTGAETVESDALRSHLSVALPEYMVPAAYVRLDALPFTPTGKLDRRALPAPESESYARHGYEAPIGETEQALAEIWADVLGVERVGRHDDFFKLGGHSLLVVRVIARMRQRGLHAEVRSLFDRPTLAALAVEVGGESREVVVPANAIPVECDAITPEMLPLVALEQAEIDSVVTNVPGGAANVQDIYPLAPFQEGVLFHHLMTTEGDPYLLAALYGFESREGLDRYLAALQAVVDRHDILRTSVTWDGLREPVQVVWRKAPLRVEEVALDPADGDAAEQLRTRFDPRHYRIDLRTAPMMRIHIARDEARDRWLLLYLPHHIITDHTTGEVLRAEIEAHLAGRADALPEPLPFRGYVAQARLGVSAEEHREFFTDMLGAVDEPTAPFGLLDARGDGSGIAEARLDVDARLSARLRERARALGVSVASVCHVAWAQVLARAAGRDDVVFGTLLFGRMQGGEGADRVMGPFINTLPIRVCVGDEGVEASVRHTHARLARLLRHEHASLALAQRCSAVDASAPLFTALMNYRHGGSVAPSAAVPAGADGMGVVFVEERSNYPLGLAVDDLDDGFSLTVQATETVDPARVCRYVHQALAGLVDALETAPERALRSLDVLPASERRQVVEAWNATDAERSTDRCMHELFEAWAERTPDAVALVVGDETLSFAELNARANRLAHHFRSLGVGPEVRVGVCAERSLEMVLAPLAVMKAGGAYVPLDPALPDERLRYMVEDSAAALVLAQGKWASRVAGMDVPVLVLDERVDASAENPERAGLTAENAAYVIYTSGSTGTPKGVVVPHHGVSTLIEGQDHAYRVGPDSRVMQNLSFGFDACVWEKFVTLCRGATLHVPAPDLLPGDAMKDAVAKHQITHMMLTTATLATLPPDARMDSVRTLIVSGEALTDSVARRWADGRRLLNGYGPTEATIGATWHEYDAAQTANGGVPIGRPFAHWRVYVLDSRGEPAPVGVAGEMFIGGAGVARGYLNRPALTAERYVPDPFSAEPGARLYRTGDLARWRSDGALEFVGRNDHQVKIRGFRVEPGEVEARLLEHAAVRETAVVPREDVPGQKRLVAYFVTDSDVAAEELRAHLSDRLPDFMVPAAYVRLDALPLTANGKLDRKSLPAPADDAYARRGHEAPLGETEQALADIWSEVLGVERVGRRDDFFELGGHSLLAMQVISRVRQVLEVEVALGELFARPVLEDFARELQTAARAELPPIVPVEREGRVPLSLAQTRLWFLEQLGNLGGAYHIRAPLRLKGELDRDALARALDRIVARHEALRTTFAEDDGVPEQRIAPADVGFARREHDVSGAADTEAELGRLMDEEENTPFDLGRGPLIRGRLIRLAADDHVLLITMHHIVSDGWSMGVLFGELSALYAADREGREAILPDLPVQYADYAAWQRRWVEGEILLTQADYWMRTLAGAPALLELPTDHPRPAQVDHAGAWLGVELDEDLTAGLKALGRRHGTTLFMTLLAGWAAVLSRLSGQDDVVIGSPMADRGRREIEGLIGFFINTLAIRIDLSGAPAMADLLARVKAQALEAQHHQDIPFEQVVELVDPARSLSHHPLFQVAFAWQETLRGGGLSLPGIEVGRVGAGPSRVHANTDLHLSLWENGEQIVGGVTYATSLFDRGTVERHFGCLRRALEEMVADESRRVDRLSLLSDDERALVVEAWSHTEAPYPDASCIHELFEAQVARTPDAAALVWDGGRLSYRELDVLANRLAHHLRALGIGPDARVGVCVERGVEMVVGMLGVLKAGGAYVPLDPGYPADRLAYMLADSAPSVVLTQRHLRDRVEHAGVPVLDLDADAAAWADRPETEPERGALAPDHLAYLIYTSGSTGRPKGVMVGHRGACNLVTAQVAAFGVEPESRVLQFASFSFDASVSEVLMALCTGAALHLPPRGALLAGDALVRALDGITHVTLPQAVLATFPGGVRLDSVRTLVLAGEALPEAVARRWAAGRRLINAYGPTEATVCATLHECRDGEEGSPPIGRPMANVRVHALDRAGEPVPVGVAGELYIGGAGVARGYLGRPGLTAERFVPDSFGGAPGERLYRTGDLGRWRADGTIEYLGRTDFQVKIRGFRVELGEIEARLAEHPDVRDAVVLVREDAPGEKRLVAYVAGEEIVGADVLRTYLAETLPEYMVPAAFVRLERLPLTPNGKLDRAALPAPEGDAHAAQAYEAPAGETEQALAGIWAEVLGIPRVGRHDNFFELGGHSLLAVQVIARAREIGIPLEVQALFEAPTLTALAAEIGGGSREVEVPANGIPAGCDAITPEMLPLVSLEQAEIDEIVAGVPGGAANVQDIYPLARLQEGVLFHHLMATEGDPYLAAILYAFDGREGVDRYLRAFQAVVDRHDILRTAVVWEGLPEPVQVVWRKAPLQVEEVALDPVAGDAAAQLRARFDPRHYRIDVRQAPMVRVRIAHDRAGDRWLVLLLDHHLTGDHTAKEVMQAEIEAFMTGRGDALPAPLPFRAYVAQARLGVSQAEHREFFDEMLGDVEEPTAPFGLLDARGDGSGMDEASVLVDPPLTARLRERARALGVSVASVCHLAWARVLARATGRDDVVFGTVLFGRMHGGEGADRVMGPFINTLPIRIRAGEGGVEASVRGTHALLARLLRHEHASLTLAQRCSGVEAPAPLFTALLNFRHGGSQPRAEAAPGGMTMLHGEERSNYPLTMSVTDLGEEGDGLRGIALTAKIRGQVGAGRICALMHAALEGLVGALETAPERPVASIAVLSAEERARVLESWNRTEAAYPSESCVHALFERQVERAPDAEAVVSDREALTYAELNRRANRLAHHLRSLGVGPDARVGICVERGPEIVVGLLAILKAGGAYVPLDPEYPADRLAYMLADAAPAVVLTQASLADRFAGAPRIRVDADAAWWAHAAETNPARGALTPEHLAYVIYTSGSTGRPKGVMNQHRTLVNRLAWGRRAWEIDGGEAILCKTSLSFDGSVREIFLPLIAGGRVVLARPGGHRDPAYLLETIAREHVTTVNLVPSQLQVLLEERDVDDLRGLKRVLCGGEALPGALLERFRARLPEVELHNLYGPSEAATALTLPRCEAEPGRTTVPVGAPIANTRVYVLDGAGEPMPVGAAGELYVGGAGVARGYLGRPTLTAERFVPDPFSPQPGARLYRTGDRVRWLADGTVDFLGRTDFQVKVRGFRIEPGEIEARLAEHPGVREAVVVARDDGAGGRRLVAYCVADGAVEADSLRAHAAGRLPEYMVPAAYVRLDALPLTPNGKLDRAALPVPPDEAFARREYEAPADETEQALAAIWSEALGVPRVGRRDDFFELGGHSLLAVRVISRLRQVLDVEVALGTLFTRPVLEDFAREVVEAQLALFDPEELAQLAALLDESALA